MKRSIKTSKTKRKDLKISDDVWREMRDLPKEKREAFISQECAKVIVKLIKALRIKQGKCVRVNFHCIEMQKLKYFGFTTRNKQQKNWHFSIEGKRYTFFLSVDGVSYYGVQCDDHLRLLTICSVLRRKYENCSKQKAKNLSCWRKRR